MRSKWQRSQLRKTRALQISLSLILLACTGAYSQTASWAAQAKAVTITRDDWGIAHIHGHTDADAVFGMIYAQCEDDFHRVERNYLTSLGRTAEADGEQALWADLRQRLFLDPEQLKRDYAASPQWLRALMTAWADGINFYLAQHPQVHPQVLTRFEPWMALSFTEGSIGGDIERIDLAKLRAFYDPARQLITPSATGARNRPGALGATYTSLGRKPEGNIQAEAQRAVSVVYHVRRPAIDRSATPPDWREPEPKGSNGIAIAPANTRDHHALLLINPHTSFFFRAEQQVTSDEGLNAYGAATWGQFFIYQGFNDRAGWMHTSSGVDAVDEFTETLAPQPGVPHDHRSEAKMIVGGIPPQATLIAGHPHPIQTKPITLAYSTSTGPKTRIVLAQYSTHGPIIRSDNGHPIAIRLMNIPIPALQQSFLRTKARTYAEYRKTMELQANSSNNTLFASADGDIAYWHGNFIPRRDPKFDYTKPVDGTNPATDWQGLLPLDQTPQLHNPASGYVFNVNDSPWNGAGPSSLKQSDYPAYVEQGIESARGLHAIRVLKDKKDFTLDSLQAAAYDRYLPWFARTLPKLLTVNDALPESARALLPEIALLRGWDYRWSADSTATTLAVYWGTELMRKAGPGARKAGMPSEDYVATQLSASELLYALSKAAKKLEDDFGSSATPWSKVNRFQRLNDDLTPTFHDDAPSTPVAFPSALWGSLASFGARPYPNTKDWYGTSGNSFVAVVEFGPRVHARAVTAGGESGDPNSPHFNDEAQRYATGNLREVYFYPDQLKLHTERTYHPGD